MPIESLTDRFGRTWTLRDGCYCCGGMKVGANARDPLNTMNAMAPKDYEKPPIADDAEFIVLVEKVISALREKGIR